MATQNAQGATPPMAPLEGPPYPIMTAGLGGRPTVGLDVPVTAVFMFLFFLGAIGHMTVFQLNRRRGHMFPMSGAMFGFCMARILACTLRIVWACRVSNVPIAITASIFIAIGDLLGFIVNLNIAQRIIRALHPSIGWHLSFKIFFAIIYSVIAISVGLLIGFTVNSFYTLDATKHRQSRDVQLYGATYFAFAATLPIFLVLMALVKPRKGQAEKFGRYSLRIKIITLLCGAFVLALGAWFRIGTSYPNPRPATNAAPYQSKACFYVFYFTLEILVIWGYLLVRIDLMFHVPDGSKGPGDYSRSTVTEEDPESHVDADAVHEKSDDITFERLSIGKERSDSPLLGAPQSEDTLVLKEEAQGQHTVQEAGDVGAQGAPGLSTSDEHAPADKVVFKESELNEEPRLGDEHAPSEKVVVKDPGPDEEPRLGDEHAPLETAVVKEPGLDEERRLGDEDVLTEKAAVKEPGPDQEPRPGDENADVEKAAVKELDLDKEQHLEQGLESGKEHESQK